MVPARVGFLGFGEAGSNLARGLGDAGVDGIVAFDIAWQDRPLISERARWASVELVPTPADLMARCDIAISAVVCSEAEAAALSIADHVSASHWVLDINSVGATTKQRCDALVRDHGGRYVDVALMANVSSELARLPFLTAGPDDPGRLEVLTGAGLTFENVGDAVGVAAQTKLCRSLLIKGLEALALEAMLASYAGGSHEVVLASIERSFGTESLADLVRHLLGRHAVHGRRRADELLEVAEALEDVGVDPLLARAGNQRMRVGIDAGLQDHFVDARRDPPWEQVLEELHRRIITLSDDGCAT